MRRGFLLCWLMAIPELKGSFCLSLLSIRDFRHAPLCPTVVYLLKSMLHKIHSSFHLPLGVFDKFIESHGPHRHCWSRDVFPLLHCLSHCSIAMKRHCDPRQLLQMPSFSWGFRELFHDHHDREHGATKGRHGVREVAQSFTP